MKFPKAAAKFREFHAFDPKEHKPFSGSFSIPPSLYRIGPAKWVAYASDKWHKGKRENYIHDHKKGVYCYGPEGEGPLVQVPYKFQTVQVLVRLGKCISLGFELDGEEYEVASRNNELFCSTHKHPALYVVSQKKDLVAMVWGGQLRIEDRGIVG